MKCVIPDMRWSLSEFSKAEVLLSTVSFLVEFNFDAFTMLPKQCHTRLTGFAFSHNKKRFSFGPKTVRVSSSRREWSNISPAKHSWTASLGSSSSAINRGRRQAGLTHVHLSQKEHSSVSTVQYDAPPDVPKLRKLFFDTHAVVRILEENGFTPQQAEALVKELLKMTNSTMETIYSDMVTKVQQEITIQRVMSQIVALKKDMIILEKSEFSTLLAENEKLKIQLCQLKVQLADVMNKVRSETLLDMNLEKSRVKELKADHERKLLETQSEIMEMTSEQDRHLIQTNMKIDTEVAGLKTMLESHKLDTIKYLAGSVFTCLTVVLGFYRIWM
ncbi:mitochondrial calcium uniporter regulator 1 [Syngnathoides biaculeatus]|uniref:mitochondrial calcium uniporter regulator 1 n=1 Tax=Syngnathoides biaculeatus TaxID=300417 RepID=UPI002ADD721A|nr:mitochondrial calcium uniporter regulator 1 [Syngnathoides biaculeatus]